MHTSWVQDMTPEARRYYLAFRLALSAQNNDTSLAKLDVDPLAPDFDAATLKYEPALPTHMREQMRELGGDMDTLQSYCAPRLSWRDDEAGGSEDKRDE